MAGSFQLHSLPTGCALIFHHLVHYPTAPAAGTLLEQRDLIANWDEFSQKNGKGLVGWTEATAASVCTWSTITCVDGNVAAL